MAFMLQLLGVKAASDYIANHNGSNKRGCDI